MKWPYLLLAASLIACSPEPPRPVHVPQDPIFLTRGRELTVGLAACGRCHGQTLSPNAPLSGGRVFTDTYGDVQAPNITPSQSGIGSWTDDEIIETFRGAWKHDDERRPFDLHRGYEWMSDKDAFSIVAYLRSVSPIKNEVYRREIDFIDRNTTGFFEVSRAVDGHVPEPPKKVGAIYGKYLVDHVARCTACHNTPETLLSDGHYLGGGTVTNEFGTKSAPELTSKQTVSGWTEPQLVKYLKSGARPDGSFVDSHFCPIEFYKHASDSDLIAIAQYIRSF